MNVTTDDIFTDYKYAMWTYDPIVGDIVGKRPHNAALREGDAWFVG
jgi:hypothetical protein